jgi:hypothetical protein
MAMLLLTLPIHQIIVSSKYHNLKGDTNSLSIKGFMAIKQGRYEISPANLARYEEAVWSITIKYWLLI